MPRQDEYAEGWDNEPDEEKANREMTLSEARERVLGDVRRHCHAKGCREGPGVNRWGALRPIPRKSR
jgi:hypothetical protein